MCYAPPFENEVLDTYNIESDLLAFFLILELTASAFVNFAQLRGFKNNFALRV